MKSDFELLIEARDRIKKLEKICKDIYKADYLGLIGPVPNGVGEWADEGFVSGNEFLVEITQKIKDLLPEVEHE